MNSYVAIAQILYLVMHFSSSDWGKAKAGIPNFYCIDVQGIQPYLQAQATNFYNKGKSGVDVKNKSLYYYNAKRISRRWPHASFCYMVSLFTDNAFILFSELQSGLVQNIRQSGRKEFILKLSEELSKPKMELRTNSVSYMLRIFV